MEGEGGRGAGGKEMGWGVVSKDPLWLMRVMSVAGLKSSQDEEVLANYHLFTGMA